MMAAGLALAAAEAVAHALSTGHPAVVDRSLHCGPRLDQIERAPAGAVGSPPRATWPDG